jgi:hypothetical protein
MKDKKKSQEADKYGKITPGKASKLLVDIIGRNVILDFVKPEKNRQAYEAELQRMYNGEMDYYYFYRLQCYIEQFFEKIEKDYEVSPLVRTSLLDANLQAFIWDFSLYAESNKILEKSKNEIAFSLLHWQAFHYISYGSSKKGWLSDLPINAFKTSEEKILEFLTDSYKKIFDEIMQIFKNNEAFYKEINNHCQEHREKYPKLTKEETVIDYKQNIINWCHEKNVYNPNWKVLVPVLDCLRKSEHVPEQKRISFVHRLIGLYLRKNAQKTFADILNVSEDEIKRIIVKIVNMIKEKKRPEKIPTDIYFDNIWFDAMRKNIVKCLQFQNNYENIDDVTEANNIIKYLEHNYSRYSGGKFLYFWLQTRAKIFEKHSDLKDNKILEDIIKDYKKAFGALINDGVKTPFLEQFLVEIMLINEFFHPRRVKAVNDYYEYGCIFGEFNANKRELYSLKEFKNPDIRKILVNVNNKHCHIIISR